MPTASACDHMFLFFCLAQIRVLAPEQILERLVDRFAMLGRGSRSAPKRQQTLRSCVDWSFGLCAKPERLLFERTLSVNTAAAGGNASLMTMR